MNRSDNWPWKLRCFIEAMRDAEFAWGKCDCCSNACEWIRLASRNHVDVYEDFRGYTTEAEAKAKILEVTGGAGDTVEAAAAYVVSKYGIEEVSPAFAQRGDIVLFEGTEGQMLGIVSMHPSWSLFVTAKGFMGLPTKTCKKAWRV